MGLPMLKRLIEGGLHARGFDIRSATEYTSDAKYMLTSPRELAMQSDVLLSVVRDREQTLDLCFNDQGIFEQSTHPSILVLCSTLSPATVIEVKNRLPKDVQLVDAPMSGSTHGAKDGTLTFMIGGDNQSVDAIQPALDLMGSRICHLGQSGAGMVFKVLNNYMAALSTVGVRRVIDLARHYDVDHQALLDVMSTSSGATWFGNEFQEIEWSGEGFETTNTIGILEKDVNAALEDIQVDGDTGHPLDQVLLLALRQLEQLKP